MASSRFLTSTSSTPPIAPLTTCRMATSTNSVLADSQSRPSDDASSPGNWRSGRCSGGFQTSYTVWGFVAGLDTRIDCARSGPLAWIVASQRRRVIPLVQTSTRVEAV